MPILRKLFLILSLSASFSLFAAKDATLAVWVNEAIVNTYTYNYQNFLARQKEIATYFTADGWINYTKALNDAKLPDSIQKNAYNVSAVALMPPDIKQLQDNIWQATMPLLVIYKNPQYQQKQTLNVTVQFTAVPSGQGVRGLAMMSLVSKVTVPPCECVPKT